MDESDQPGSVIGADDGIRTRDPNLGKVVLYQLSHVRTQKDSLAKPFALCKPRFQERNRLLESLTAVLATGADGYNTPIVGRGHLVRKGRV